MISLSAPVFDPSGHIVIDELPNSDIHTVTRRVSRAATLGPIGAVMNDMGHFASDRTFVVRWLIQHESQYDTVRRLLRLYSRLHVATSEGAFIAAPEQLSMSDDGEATLSLLILEATS